MRWPRLTRWSELRESVAVAIFASGPFPALFAHGDLRGEPIKATASYRLAVDCSNELVGIVPLRESARPAAFRVEVFAPAARWANVTRAAVCQAAGRPCGVASNPAATRAAPQLPITRAAVAADGSNGLFFAAVIVGTRPVRA